MSMQEYPIMMFGVDAADIDIKPEYWMPWEEIKEDTPPPEYDDIYDFVEDEINDPYICCLFNEYNNYIGIRPCYEWELPDKKVFRSKEDAADYIAKKLAPFCDKSEAKIKAVCDYIEDTYLC